MLRIRLVHWKEEEAADKAAILRAAGHEVVSGGEYRDWKSEPVDAYVIDLSRLPSHGREVAASLRASKATRAIPILFADGAPEKVEATRAVLPDAVYTSWPEVVAEVQNLRRLENPVVPTRMMDRYAGRTTAQKLGIKENSSVTVVNPPRDYIRVLGDLPASVEVYEDSAMLSPVTVCFVPAPEMLADALTFGRGIAAKTKFWVCWKKGKKALLTEDGIRGGAIALGLVDYKVCSLDPTWSGVALARSK
jgi:hypothetical protein